LHRWNISAECSQADRMFIVVTCAVNITIAAFVIWDRVKLSKAL